jgi:predicted DCC family thiol-disulfide oxidoreductase YuxK
MMTGDGRLNGSQDAPVVIYDGRCRFCVRQAAKLAGSGIVLRSFHDEGVLDDYAGLTPQSCETEIKLIVGERMYGGADALVRAFAIRHPTLARLLPVYDMPVIRHVARALYRWIASHRHRLPGGGS